MTSPSPIHSATRNGSATEPVACGAHIDHAAFADLYDRYRGPLHAFCLPRCPDPTLVDDVVQSAFAKAWAGLAAFDHRRPFWPWLASIAARECLDLRRRLAYAEQRQECLHPPSGLGPFDPTADTVLARTAQARLQREMAVLPDRQRIALQLLALDDWSYADIADQLGVNTGTVKALVNRARTRLREIGGQALGGLVGAGRALSGRLQQVAGRVHELLFGCTEVLAACGQGVGAVLPVLAAVAAGLSGWAIPVSAGSAPPAPGDGASAVRVGRPVPSTVAEAAPVGRVDRGRPPAGATPPPSPVGTAERTVHQAAAPVLFQPPSDASPERAYGTTVAVSPDYEQDRTMFVASSRGEVGRGALLLVTRDGGASWSRPAAVGYAGADRLFFPPAYPHDHRLFAAGPRGLQVSHDGGDTFETIPSTTALAATRRPWEDVAMSPAFSSGDPSFLLVVGGQVFEYRDDTGTVRQLVLGTGSQAREVVGAQYSSDYEHDRTVLVAEVVTDPAAARPLSAYPLESSRVEVGRCIFPSTEAGGGPGAVTRTLEPACSHVALPRTSGGVFRMGTSPRGAGHAVYLRSGFDLFVSTDGGRTFGAAAPWTWGGTLANDVHVLPSTTGTTAVVAQWDHYGGAPLLRTDDGGGNWQPLSVDLPGFREGARAVAVTPTGRIVATGIHGGIACSADDGRTWAHLCPTPDTA